MILKALHELNQAVDSSASIGAVISYSMEKVRQKCWTHHVHQIYEQCRAHTMADACTRGDIKDGELKTMSIDQMRYEPSVL